MKSFTTLKSIVSQVTQHMLNEARKHYPVVRSRGRWLGYLDIYGNACDDKVEWDGTKRGLLRYVESHSDKATEVFIDLGAGGANCVRDWADFNYDPWVEEDSIVIWDHTKGWHY